MAGWLDVLQEDGIEIDEIELNIEWRVYKEGREYNYYIVY